MLAANAWMGGSASGVSIGSQTGPRIGVQEGPHLSTWRAAPIRAKRGRVRSRLYRLALIACRCGGANTKDVIMREMAGKRAGGATNTCPLKTDLIVILWLA
jgi:hypothetical protein